MNSAKTKEKHQNESCVCLRKRKNLRSTITKPHAKRTNTKEKSQIRIYVLWWCAYILGKKKSNLFTLFGLGFIDYITFMTICFLSLNKFLSNYQNTNIPKPGPLLTQWTNLVIPEYNT